MLIENITAGMYVNTGDDGPQMVRWIGNSTVYTEGNQRPTRIKKGSFGATSDLTVSPQHRIMLGRVVVWRTRGVGESQRLDQ